MLLTEEQGKYMNFAILFIYILYTRTTCFLSILLFRSFSFQNRL